MRDEERKRLEALNTDHHARMAVMHLGHHQSQIDRWAVQNQESRRRIVDALLGCEHRTRARQGKPTVLELGAGSGGDRPYLEERLGADYVGIDVVRGPQVPSFVLHMPVEDMPESWSGKFHFVYSRHVMEHVINVDLALSNLKRVLAPNGIIGAVTPHVFPDPEPAHVTQQTLSEWCGHYRRHGLRPVYAKLEEMACQEAHIVLVHEAFAKERLD